MQHNHTQVAPTVRTQKNPAWETTKWIIAIGAILHICYTLLTAGGVL